MGNNSSSQLDNNNINIITYNTKLDFFSTYKCNKLVNYLSNLKRKKSIICLQGINNNKSMEYILENLKEFYQSEHVIPSNNLIFISSFKIQNNEFKLFNSNKILNNKKGILMTDIKVNDSLITLYNTEFTENISEDIITTSIRKKQLKQSLDIIQNKINKKDDSHSGLHILLGSLYLDEVDNKDLLDIIEFYKKELKAENKDDYILFFIKKYSQIEDLKKFILEKYNIEIIDVYFREEVNYSKNLPLELIIKFK